MVDGRTGGQVGRWGDKHEDGFKWVGDGWVDMYMDRWVDGSEDR